MTKKRIKIIGGGLAGVEAAFQLAIRGIGVDLYEMRPQVMTEVHVSPFLGEMVCSNSLGSTERSSASGLLKEELRILDSFFLKSAEENRVPAGSSLSVDRLRLAEEATRSLMEMEGIQIHREEVTGITRGETPQIICTGPLTSHSFAEAISRLTMRRNLFFFDATSPLIRSDSIDRSRMFAASRYNKGDADFLNIPLDKEKYDRFVEELVGGEVVEAKDFENQSYFEACLPIEEIARRGPQSLSFGPLKPVGLSDPVSGSLPHAVVQLRADDVQQHLFQMVGFQTRLKWGEQKRIFRLLPGLENAEFERFGRMHRNTYINAPLVLNSFFQMKMFPSILIAGQLSGVEGYVESIASGLIAALQVAAMLKGKNLDETPETTAIGSLCRYISHSAWKDFKPSKFSFGLLPDKGILVRNKKNKKEMKAERALSDLRLWIRNLHI